MTDDNLIKQAEDIMRRASRPSWEHKYILDGKTPVPCPNVLKWARWFETANRHVAKTQTNNGEVSTVFLGINHNWLPNGPPILFETMVFGGIFDKDCERYSTWEEAEEGHKRKVKYVTELE